MNDISMSSSGKRLKLLTLSLVCFAIAIAGMLGLLGISTEHVDVMIRDYQITDEGFQQAAALMGANIIAIGLLLLVGSWLFRSHFPQYRAGLHPPVLLTAWILLGCGIPGFLGFYYPDILGAMPVRLDIDLMETAWGWTLVLVGLTSLWAGYILTIQGFQPEPTSGRHENIPSLKVVLRFYLITVILRVIRIIVEGRGLYTEGSVAWGPVFSLFSQTLYYLEVGYYMVLAMLVIQAWRGKWPKRLAYIVVAIEVLYALTGTFSSQLLKILFVVGTAVYSIGRLTKRSIVLLIIPAIILAIAVVPVSETLRVLEGTYDINSPVAIGQATIKAFQQSWGLGLDTGWEIFWTKVSARLAPGAVIPGLIMSQVPEVVPYEGLEEFLKIPLYVVPRFLWPTKPSLSRGRWVSYMFFDLPEDTLASAAETFFGGAYQYYGWVGTILASFLYGVVFGFAFRWTTGKNRAFLYAALVPAFIWWESFVGQLIGFIQAVPTIIFLYWLLMKLSSQYESMSMTDNSEKAVGSHIPH